MKYTAFAYLAAALSGSLAIFNGGQVALRSLTPPPIEGFAFAPDTVKAGEDVLVYWTIIKRTDCPGENARVFQGEGGFLHRDPLGETRLPQSDTPNRYAIQTSIPNDAPIGDLSLSIEGFYQCQNAEKRPFVLGPVRMQVVSGDG